MGHIPFDVNSEVWLCEVKIWPSSSSVYGPLPKKNQFCIFLHNGLTRPSWILQFEFNANHLTGWGQQFFFPLLFFTWKDFKNDAKIYRQKWNHADIRLQTIKDSDGENYCTELLKYKQKCQITCYSTTLWPGLSKNCLNVIMIIK